MLRLFSLVAVAGLAACEHRVVVEPSVPAHDPALSSWRRDARVPGDEAVDVAFWLKHDAADRAAFHDKLLHLSTPGDPEYGHWLSRDEVAAALAPSAEAVEVVSRFAREVLGASDVKVSKLRDVVSVRVAARDAERGLETVLHRFSHTSYRAVEIVRAAAPVSLPESVASHVLVVGDLVRLPRLRESTHAFLEEEAQSNATGASPWARCGAEGVDFTNPFVLAERYSFPFPRATAAAGNALGLAEFQRQYFDDSDLAEFSRACGLDEPVTVARTVGGNVPIDCRFGLEPCVESLLDIEYAGAIAGKIPLTVYYSADYSLLELAQQLADDDDAPKVMSVSYGNDEAQQTGAEYMDAVNTAFMKLSATGVSILFAAGDQGVWGREGGGKRFHPDFPAGSPYVTAVGGTNFETKSEIGNETTWSSGGSGFSDQFAAPDFQAAAIAAYMDTASDALPSARLYNASGRAYPDLSALAGQLNPYFIAFKGGKLSAVAGTSAACPVVAAIIAQLNDERMAAGKPALGWLNPLLYAATPTHIAKAFHDVTTGKTNGGFLAGFPAAEGWDAATGFGTPKYAGLRKLALKAVE